MVTGSKALSPGDGIPDFWEKESQTLGMRDPLPKATRTTPSRLPLDSPVQRVTVPQPHTSYEVSHGRLTPLYELRDTVITIFVGT